MILVGYAVDIPFSVDTHFCRWSEIIHLHESVNTKLRSSTISQKTTLTQTKFTSIEVNLVLGLLAAEPGVSGGQPGSDLEQEALYAVTWAEVSLRERPLHQKLARS